MNSADDLKILFEVLQQQRDEIAVKLHLAGMEITDEWKRLDAPWTQFREKLDEIEDETKNTTENLTATAKIIGDELKNAYQRITRRIDERVN